MEMYSNNSQGQNYTDLKNNKMSKTKEMML